MSVKLTWQDLLVQDVTDSEFEDWIAEWRGVISGRGAVIFLNRFGVWFLRRPDDSVDMLDVFSGDVARVADTYDDFVGNVNDQAWQEVYLLSKVVYALHGLGKVPGPRECYAVAPPAPFGGPNPMAGDELELDRVSILAIPVWQSICAQAVRGGTAE